MARKNRNYGKYDSVTKRVEYAPIYLKIDSAVIMNPTKELYLKTGWKEVVENPPKTETGYHCEERGWNETVDTIEKVYEIVKDTETKNYRTFSKLKFVSLMMKMGKWNEVMEWIDQNNLHELYLAAQVFREDNEYFLKGKTEIQNLLGLKDYEVEKILNQCIAED